MHYIIPIRIIVTSEEGFREKPAREKLGGRIAGLPTFCEGEPSTLCLPSIPPPYPPRIPVMLNRWITYIFLYLYLVLVGRGI